MKNLDQTGTFMDLVAGKFALIKSKFINKCKTNEMEFDEDLFMDTFICCCKTLKDKKMSIDECIKYYWVSYLNKIKTNKPKEHRFESFDELTGTGAKISFLGTGPYDRTIDDQYNDIITYIYSKYKKEYADAWILHTCEGKSYKELEEIGYNFKFNDVFKRMTRNIRSEFKKDLH